MSEAVWTRRSSRNALWLGSAAWGLALIGLVLARYDLVPKIFGLFAMLGGTALALLGTLAGVIGVFLSMKHSPALRKTALLGLALSAVYAGFMLSRAAVARNVPPIHDITTNLANPPAFTTLALRADNLAGVGSVEKWQALHTQAYGDLKTVTIAKPVAAVLSDAERIGRDMGWDIAVSDPQAGRLEATASVSFIRYKDDMVLRVQPTADGKSSTVDMRSVSRIGESDLGVNAKRIRAFLAQLSAA